MREKLPRRSDPLAIKPDPGKSAEACRVLIRAYLTDPQHDVQDAVEGALAAFGLPDDWIETEAGRFQ